MNGGSNGASNRMLYDNCNYQRLTRQSTDPLAYNLYQGKYENCSKCIYDNFYVPYQPEIIDMDSELKNLTRPLSDCDQYKYNPNCRKSRMCVSTFDKSNPVVLAPEVCPIVHNNIPRRTSPGYTMPNPDFCII